MDDREKMGSAHGARMATTETYAAETAYRDEMIATQYDRRRFSSWRGRLGDWLDKRALQRALDHLPQEGSMILDVPCGTGRVTSYLIDNGYEVTAADISAEMIVVARGRLVDRFVRTRGYIQADAIRLPFCDAAFACTTAIRFMGHIPPSTRVQILRELARVSRGYVIADYCIYHPVVYMRRRIEHFLKTRRLGFDQDWIWQSIPKRQLEDEFRAAELQPVGWFAKMRPLSDAWVVLLARGECGKNDSYSSMHVFYVEPVGAHRGMHYYDLELCPNLQSLGIDVTLLTCDETKSLGIPQPLRVEFPFQDIYGKTSKVIRGLHYLRGLARVGLAMLRRRIPLAHFHYFHFPPLDYLCLRWLRMAGKRIVITVHDVIPFDAKATDLPWLRRLYHQADRIIVHTASSRDTIVGKFKVSPDKVHVIPMGPYLSFAKEQMLPAQLAKQCLGLEPNAPVILFFGQLKKVKGLQYLIRAFRQVSEQCPTARLIIAGPEWKEPFAGYATLIDELNLADKVLARIEYVPDEEVGLYYSAADVVALPYTEVYQSAVLYMAYSFARPVVASTVGGLAEVVEDGVTGLLVPPADVDRLASALFTLLHDREMARVMGEKGRSLVETKFGWQEIARQTAKVYEEALPGEVGE